MTEQPAYLVYDKVCKNANLAYQTSWNSTMLPRSFLRTQISLLLEMKRAGDGLVRYASVLFGLDWLIGGEEGAMGEPSFTTHRSVLALS